LADWLGESSSDTALPLLPEVQKLKGMKILCFYGTEEGDTLCKDLKPELATVIPLKGGHHFDGNYSAMAQTILNAAR
jgi:type IV secretory pathway VirJ component